MTITKIHYYPFNATPFVPVTPEVVTKYHELPIKQLHPLALDNLLTEIDKGRLCIGKFNNTFLRLRIEVDGGKKIIKVDGDGCVQNNGQEYYLRPRIFLKLYVVLNTLWEIKQERRRRGLPPLK